MDPVIPNDQPAPDFQLADLTGRQHRLQTVRGRVVVLNFWSAECPWVERTDRALLAYVSDWGDAVALWSIASNANEPGELLQRVASQRGLPVVLLDHQREAADLYGALTTPHLFVVDRNGILRYQGAFDDVTFRQRTPSRFYLREAVEAVLAGRRPEPAQAPPYGCSIVR
jgi:peroxiredoxin